jgi:hypothetical protein
MAFDPKSDTWIPPCDLCGSFRYTTEELPAGHTARRCLDCGLVSVEHGEHRVRGEAPLRGGLPEGIMIEALTDLRGERSCSALVIGFPSTAVVEAASAAGARLSVLVEPGSGEVPNVPTFQASLETHSFLPDQFDMILCARGLEAFPSPSLLFDRSRQWLTPGGALLVSALNLDSLPARLRRRNWFSRYAMSAEHLLSLNTIKRYAERFGFDIRSVRTRSRTEEVAALMTGHDRSAWITEMASAPLALAASLLGMGVLVVVEMTKGGLAVRPLLRNVEEQVDAAPGLAPALYTGVQREMVEELVVSS